MNFQCSVSLDVDIQIDSLSKDTITLASKIIRFLLLTIRPYDLQKNVKQQMRKRYFCNKQCCLLGYSA